MIIENITTLDDSIFVMQVQKTVKDKTHSILMYNASDPTFKRQSYMGADNENTTFASVTEKWQL